MRETEYERARHGVKKREDIIWMDIPGSIDNGGRLFVAGIIAATGCGGGWK